MIVMGDMTWEYRVVKHTCEADGFTWFDIREVYHSGGVNIIGNHSDSDLSWTAGSKCPIGDSPGELRADLEMMLKALELPVLEEKGDTLIEVSDD